MSGNSKPQQGMMGALKRAFTWHWHLLGLGAGVGLALLSGSPQAVIPLVLAAELAYLGFLGLNPRFQNVLRAASGQPPSLPVDPNKRFQKLMSFLSERDAERFQTLRHRCGELLTLRRSMTIKEGISGVEDLRSGSLDRMLWLFLKLLHQRSGMERFLGATPREMIESELKSAEEQLADAQARDKEAGLPESRLVTSIRERSNTIRERLENHHRAEDSLELVSAEIDKTAQQITHLCETGMTMSDAGGLSAQIDSISQSLQSSERIFSETRFSQIYDDEPAPSLLEEVSGSGKSPIAQ